MIIFKAFLEASIGSVAPVILIAESTKLLAETIVKPDFRVSLATSLVILPVLLAKEIKGT